MDDPPVTPSPALSALMALAQAALARKPGLVVLGLSGAQGSGKSTLADALADAMTACGIAVAVLSIDDLYLTRAERLALAATVHPLLITRGVPGTHDVALGLATIAALARGEPVALPRFDKALDDRVDPALWPLAPADTRLLILEGWCLGARAQSDADLIAPANGLEALEDADGRWRRHVNAALMCDYPALWARIDMLAMLCPPDFATIVRWRQQQERALRRRAPDGPGVMSDGETIRFVMHYERVTKAVLDDLPRRADLVFMLDQTRTVQSMIRKPI